LTWTLVTSGPASIGSTVNAQAPDTAAAGSREVGDVSIEVALAGTPGVEKTWSPCRREVLELAAPGQVITGRQSAFCFGQAFRHLLILAQRLCSGDCRLQRQDRHLLRPSYAALLDFGL
jgi:hypothetical protein